MSRPFIQKSFRLANRNQFYFLVIVCSLCQPKIDIKAHVSFISSAQPALLHVNEWSISGVFDSHSRRIIKGSHGFIWCSVSLTSTGVISWTEDMQSNQGLGCKAVFWSIQIGSTCALVLVGDAEGLMRQFEAPSAAFLGPVTLGLRNEVVSPVCLQSDGCRPAIMSDERERGRASTWSAVTGTGGSDLLSVRPQPGLAAPNPHTPMPSGEKHNLNCLHEKG